jgi:4-hydroxybenzoate polyprenyltransferase
MATDTHVELPIERRMSRHRFGPWFAWLQLVRLPNVFTAAADVTMGFLVVRGNLDPVGFYIHLLAASVSLYLAGIVLNDVLDAKLDTQERPERPIPSGRISALAAKGLVAVLMLMALAFAVMVSLHAQIVAPIIVATLLAATIVLYDRYLKQTPLGPVAMGSCRLLNVLLGMTAATQGLSGLSGLEWSIAGGIGIYVMGITWFARTEARQSSRGKLAGALAVMLTGLVILAAMPMLVDLQRIFWVQPIGWYMLWAVIGLIVARRCVLAIVDPRPARVQMAVRQAILWLIVIDASLVFGYCGPFWGCAVLALLVPASLLAIWIEQT